MATGNKELRRTRRPRRRRPWDVLLALSKDEAGSVLPEYVIVLATLSIMGTLAFNYVASTASTAESVNAQGFTSMNLKAVP